MDLSGLQTFAPLGLATSGIPIELLVDLRCESDDFDCLVPQTDAKIRYDKFNRLRLRNSITSSVTKTSAEKDSHLQDQTVCFPQSNLYISQLTFTGSHSSSHPTVLCLCN